MRRIPILFLIILATAPLMAEGAGGAEFTQPLPSKGEAALPAYGGGGFGYGVLEDGTVIRGFGMGVHKPGYNAGYGGTMQGWQHRWGPLVGLVTTKFGFGGVISEPLTGFSLLGAAEAQLGLLVLPWFEVGFKAGVMGTATFADDQETHLAWSPVVGLRFAWGAF